MSDFNLKGQVDEVLKGCVELIGRPPVTEPITINENGTYTPPEGVDGFDEVDVNIPIPEPVVSQLTVNKNGTYTPPEGVDGFDEVNVDVAPPYPINKSVGAVNVSIEIIEE